MMKSSSGRAKSTRDFMVAVCALAACVSSIVLLTFLSCAKEKIQAAMAEEVWVPEERLLMQWVSKEAELRPIDKQKSTYWLGDLWVSSRYPRSVTATYAPHYGRHRWAIAAYAPTTVGFPGMRVGKDAFVRFGWYLSPRAYAKGSDGASFRVWCATEPAASVVCVFQATAVIDKTTQPRGVHWERAPLPVQPGKEVRLFFETGPGAAGKDRADFCYWETPTIGWQRKIQPKPNEGPNAILFTLDTLRADRLSCYGYERPTSPEIDRLAKQGILMTNAYAQSTTTIPSHVSIMTGKYLKEFGIYGQCEDPLPLSYDTLAECFRRAGYATAGFISVNFMRDAWTGLGQGFRTFVECPVAYLHGEYVINPVVDWLVKNHGRRFFLWIHLYDCHVPYSAPEPFGTRFVRSPDNYPADVDPSLVTRTRDDEKFDRLSREYYSDCYDGEVAYTDHQVGRVISVLKSLRILNKTLVVIAADHGESLGEHKIYFDHVSLYEQNTRVPLIFSWPGQIPKGKRASELCENIDIGPTMLSLLKIRVPDDWSGRSLLPVWSGRRRGRPGVVSEHANHMAVSWRTNQWTYLYQPVANKENQKGLWEGWDQGSFGAWVRGAQEEELYDRKRDRQETEDLSASHVETLQKLRLDSKEWIEPCGNAWKSGIRTGAKTRDLERFKQMRELGYVGN